MTKNYDTKEQSLITKTAMTVSDDDVNKALAEAAKQSAGEEKSGGIPYISIKGSKFKLNDELIGRHMTAVVLATAYDNAYYDRKYDPDRETIVPPACFAINQDQSIMEPHADSPTPIASSCKVCEFNLFKSAENGKGKMCKNGRRLLLAPVYYNDIGEGEVDLDDLAIMRIPATSLKLWATYVKKLDAMHRRPHWSVMTRFTFDEDADWPIVKAEHLQNILNNNVVHTIMSSQNMYNELVLQPYNTKDYVAPTDDEKIGAGGSGKAISQERKSKMS